MRYICDLTKLTTDIQFLNKLYEKNKDYYFVGVDVGKKGALSILKPCDYKTLKLIEIVPYNNTILDYKTILSKYLNLNIILNVEKLCSRPLQSAQSTFTLGMLYGELLACFTCLKIKSNWKLVEVTPTVWKKYFEVTKDKQTSINLIKNIFQKIDLKRTKRCHKDDDNYAESLLIALYGYLHN